MARLPQNARLWKERAEIDYIGPFVKAWAAFNAWYRDESNSQRDRDGLDYVKTRANPVRAEILPLLAPPRDGRTESEDALELKLLVAELHRRLEDYHIEVAREDETLERITFTQVSIRQRLNLPQSSVSRAITFTVTKQNGSWISTVTNRNGQVTATISQPEYDEAALVTHPDFTVLSTTKRSHLQGLYQTCCPRPMSDLLSGTERAIHAGDFQFRCTSEELFLGLIEVIYALRNSLLHGELQPDERAFQTYEPAYRIVMRFLQCIR